MKVNGHVLVGVSHEEAIDVIRNAPREVKVLVCRAKEQQGVGGAGEGRRTDTEQGEEMYIIDTV